MIANIVTISPDVQSGTPVFAKTRVPVKTLFDYLKNGGTVEEFLKDYPSVEKLQVINLLTLLESHVSFSTYEENIA